MKRLACAGLLAALLSAGGAAAQERLLVVATTTDLKSLAEAVGGSRIAVTNIGVLPRV